MTIQINTFLLENAISNHTYQWQSDQNHISPLLPFTDTEEPV